MGRASAVLLLLLFAAVLLEDYASEAVMMGRGLGLRYRTKPQRKPWDGVRRPQYYYKYDVDSGESSSDDSQADDGPEPCVGLCYYKKLLALEQKADAEPQEEIEFQELTTRKPCVGLCHYYRTLGIENPHEK